MNPVAVTTVPEIDAEEVAARLEEGRATDAIEWMFETFGQNHYIACSFQKTSSVTAHLASTVNPDARFFYLDTDVLFPETYETRDRLGEALGIEFDRYHNLTIEEQAAEYGDELWKREPDACCGVRKVEPMRRALSSVDCWVAGVRRADFVGAAAVCEADGGNLTVFDELHARVRHGLAERVGDVAADDDRVCWGGQQNDCRYGEK